MIAARKGLPRARRRVVMASEPRKVFSVLIAITSFAHSSRVRLKGARSALWNGCAAKSNLSESQLILALQNLHSPS